MARAKKAPEKPAGPVGRKFTEPEHAALVAAWTARDDAGLAVSRAAGVVLTAAVAEAVARTNVAFATDQIIAAIGEALADPCGLATREDHADMYTVVLIVAVDRTRDTLVLALGRSSNQGDGVRTIWPALAPWFRVLAKNRPRVDAWLATPPETPGNRARGRFDLALDPPEPTSATAVEDERAALIAAIVARPDDDSLRLVLADLLQQRGDPHGELIALQCGPTTPESTAREAALLAAHGATIAGEVAQHATAYRIARGFVSSVTMAAPTFSAHGAHLLAAHPIDMLVLKPISSGAIAKLAAAPALAQLRSLYLELETRTKPVELWTLARSPHLASLRALTCKYVHAIDWVSLPALRAPQLARLTIHEGNPTLAPLAALLAGDGVPALAELVFRAPRSVPATDRDAIAALFAALAHRPALVHLAFDDCHFVDAAAMQTLYTGARSLATLEVDSERFDDAALAAITRSPVAALRSLQLVNSTVTERAVLELLRSRAGARIERLVIFAHGHRDGIDPARIAAALPASHPLRVVLLPSVTPLPARFTAPW